MNLFSESESIKEINRTLVREFSKPGVRIFGDVLLSAEDFEWLKVRLRQELKADFREHASKYSESLCMFLVYCAQHFRDDKGFWAQVGKHLIPMSSERQRQIHRQFVTTCHFYGFHDFEDESIPSQAIIAPIICHAGISAMDQEAFFQVLVEAVEDVRSSAEMDVAAAMFDYIMVHPAPLFVRSFIKALDDDRCNYLLQWYDVVRHDDRSGITGQSLREELDQDYGIEQIYRVTERHLADFWAWKHRPEVRFFPRQAPRLSTRAPQIVHDFDGLGIWVRLPQQRTASTSPIRQACWMIRTDDLVSAVDCDVYVDGPDKMYATTETVVFLKQAAGYRFELYFESAQGVPAAAWELDFKEPKARSQSSLHQDYFIRNESGATEGPELAGGERLFNNAGIYTRLPKVRVPLLLDPNWHVIRLGPSGRIELDFDASDQQELPLKQLIDPGAFGMYELRLRNQANNRYHVRFHYLPEIRIVADTGHWPQPEAGYQTDHFKCLLPVSVNLEINQVTREFETTHGMQRTLVFTNIKHYSRISGWVSMIQQSREIRIPVTISPRPILWTIINNERYGPVIMTDQSIHQSYSTLALQMEQDLLFTLGDLGAEIFLGRIIIRRSDGTLIEQREYIFKSWDTIRMNLSDLLQIPDIKSNKKFSLWLELEAPGQGVIQIWPILTVSHGLKVENLRCDLSDEALVLQWKETDDQEDRVVLLYNMLEPWADPVIWPVMDGREDVLIRSSDITKGLYIYDIQPMPELPLFGRQNYKPPRFRSDRLVKLGLREYNRSTMRTFNAKAIFFLTNEASANLDLPAIQLSNETEIIQLVKDILFFIANKAAFNQPAKVDQVLNKLAAICQQTTYSAGSLLHLLLQLPLSPAQFKTLQRYFGAFIIPANDFPTDWRASDSSKLTSLNDCTAFQTGLSRSENLQWMVRWIGEGELRQLLNQTADVNLIDLIAVKLTEARLSAVKLAVANQASTTQSAGFTASQPAGQTTRWARHDADWGIGTNNGQSFVEALKSLERNLAENPGPAKLFNDSFVKSTLPRLSILQKQYPLLFTKLSRRNETIGDPLVALTAQRIGLTALAAALYRRGLWPTSDQILIRQIARLQNLCPAIYRHDLVLIEFYLLGGGQ